METCDPAAPRASLTPHLTIRDAACAIRFYEEAFGGREIESMRSPDGRVLRAELELGGATLTLAEDFPAWGSASVQSYGGSPVSFRLVVADVDAALARALAAGALLLRPIEDQPWGERSVFVADPFGFRWNLAAPTEELTRTEVRRRMAQMLHGVG